ncbi:monovalent cation:H+ antiporter-2, CPA2 family [Prevotella communis]|uniref:Monovalent cation:H+ antiporter-2, CPA2 family n=1 Tax=Prevotella communis TaxID=2913614 RepID=A0A1H0ECQ1_9BACT|nr:cation:proton antiporter [Prevotella communis]UKK68552.1 cation:proton antiporter [Prevotella communis]UKK69313.1 cation:proton antiporter [Prevotella communis]SDH09261.1 monovalent cation:H+ antiporter-2, CPA2 family [Prevotella communis]SDN80096.1 monovalent cation:H+ antiporter-2, CPA2 family [Prevotella communis]
MAELPALIEDLALILMVAGVVTLVFKKLKQPLVLGYIVAGFLVSPHMPYTASVVDMSNIHLWADIGVMFLLFSLGLDFSFKKILKMGASPVISVICIIFAMSLLGVIVGQSFGWSRMNCIFLGGMLAMSSTTIIYKAFDDLGLRQQQFAGLVMSVLILEDILAIVMMVMLSAIASGNNPDSGQMLGSVMKIGFFLVLWLVVGIFAIPLFLRRVRKLINNEVLLIVSLGLCCAMAVFSTKVGFSSAFGAFIMGSILAETIEAERIEKLVEPVKNLFGAVFFVSVGMLVDPQILIDYALPIFVLVMTIIIGQAIFGSISFMLGGESLKSAMRCGFSMAQIGEFSFIIASLGLSLGVIGDFLYPVVVAVSVITTFLTPYMIRLATPAYNALEPHLPTRLIKMLNHLSMSRPNTTEQSKWKRLLIQMSINTIVYSILSIAVIALMLTFFHPIMIQMFQEKWYGPAITGVITIILMAPFLRAMVMKKNRSEEFKALWKESNRNRLPLIFTILFRIMIAVNFVFYVISYLTHFGSAILITVGFVAVILIIMSRSIKRRSILLERLFINNLRSRDIEAQVRGRKKPLYEGKLLDRDIHIADFDVPFNSMWMGQTLKQLNLGRKYGVHISSIMRGGCRLNIPDGDYIIFPGDKLQAIGSDDQLTKFRNAIENDVLGEDYELEKREMKLRQFIIAQDSPFIGKTLEESGIRSRYSCMVVGMEEGKENLSSVGPKHRFEEGDILWIVGEQEALDALMLAHQ